jgi:SH3-like domain-containing protein
MGVALFVISVCLSSVTQAQSTPVFLSPNNPAPTGHFDLKMLKKRAIQSDQFEWLWVRDQQGHDGWILKASALLPLDFSRQAILGKGEPIHPQPRSFKLPQKTLPKAQIVTLVKRHRDWYRIIYKDQGQKYYGWVRSRYLSPYSKDAGLFFSTRETHLRAEPKMKSKVLQKIDPGLPIIPLNTKGEWALVQFAGKKGYIPLRHLKSRLDVAIKVRTEKGYFKPHPNLYKAKVIEIFANPIWVGSGAYTIELKQKPSMTSKTVAQVPPWQDLILQGYSIKKWGKSHVSRWGELWWPDTTIESNVEIIENLTAQSIKLRTSEIYQIEKSPVIRGLRFASATHGVYRSFDGQNWYPLRQFNNGFPIKIARNGTLFVGDQVSFDHGESFQHFVRWDRVFDSVPKMSNLAKSPVQIINVEPNHNNHQQVTLSLKVGSNRYVQIYTPNLGKDWRLR